MAEAALYDYQNDPEFPYTFVNPHISWIPNFINLRTPARGYDNLQANMYHSLINILLVFCRARTSTIVIHTYSESSPSTIYCTLVNRLNDILDRVPNGEGRLHRLEIFRYTRFIWFITTKYSPRFIWKRNLSHREIGLNLDYYGAGHLRSTREESHPTKTVAFIEISGNAQIGMVIENLFLDYVIDLSHAEDFFRRQEELFNSSMSQLDLPYRFKCFYQTADSTQEAIIKVLQQTEPPSDSWWQNHVYFINVPMEPGIPLRYMTFCSANSHYKRFWPLIQEFHSWILRHTLSDWPRRHAEYWKNRETLFVLMRSVLDGQITYDRGIKAEIHILMRALTRYHDNILANTADVNESSKITESCTPPETYLVHTWHRWVQFIKMYFTETWKKEPRRRFEEVDYPLEGDSMVRDWNAWKWGDIWAKLRSMIMPSLGVNM